MHQYGGEFSSYSLSPESYCFFYNCNTTKELQIKFTESDVHSLSRGKIKQKKK